VTESFTAERQDAYLALVASGVRLGVAATEIGIPRRTISAITRRDLTFADRLDEAKTRGRAARIPHGDPKGYDNYDCRCRPCTKAASAARAQRGGRAHTDQEGEVIQWPEQDGHGGESAHSFSLAKAS
jgi:hypothetical protein